MFVNTTIFENRVFVEVVKVTQGHSSSWALGILTWRGGKTPQEETVWWQEEILERCILRKENFPQT